MARTKTPGKSGCSKPSSTPRGRGRPPKPAGRKQSGKITSYVTRNQKTRLMRAARRQDMSLSQWVAETVLAAVKDSEAKRSGKRQGGKR